MIVRSGGDSTAINSKQQAGREPALEVSSFTSKPRLVYLFCSIKNSELNPQHDISFLQWHFLWLVVFLQHLSMFVAGKQCFINHQYYTCQKSTSVTGSLCHSYFLQKKKSLSFYVNFLRLLILFLFFFCIFFFIL